MINTTKPIAAIVHGTLGSPEGNWYQWLARKLEEQGFDAYVPRFPTPENQNVASWCKAFDEQAPRFNGQTVLVGHSLGAAYLLHVLEVLDEPVAATILVAPFLERLGLEPYDTCNAPFFKPDFDWDKIRKNAGRLTIFAGDDDPYVPLAVSQRFADFLKIPLTIIKNGGHINSESGYTTFPQILEVI
ncbi:MAG: alpha/beta hydrolase [Alphaproteobacteria bacterium]|nr:alpha/beta hydrolase [Alphaproteobacteria bacterium]